MQKSCTNIPTMKVQHLVKLNNCTSVSNYFIEDLKKYFFLEIVLLVIKGAQIVADEIMLNYYMLVLP